jgi:hypothetical protein
MYNKTGILQIRVPNFDWLMKNFLINLSFWFDYVVGYMMTNPNYYHRYHKDMYTKWGERYCTKEQYDEYLENLNQEL